ncbi:MAG: beta-ACP synthase, partial [Chitinivibrionales bacterium]|nr:beta-ACP synthase [Chitinivibrionales bacterium]
SVTGHPLAAASAIEIVQCGCIMRDGIIPPTVNLYNPDPECDLDYVPHKARELEVETILKDASGFSGIHSALLLKKVNAT